MDAINKPIRSTIQLTGKERIQTEHGWRNSELKKRKKGKKEKSK